MIWGFSRRIDGETKKLKERERERERESDIESRIQRHRVTETGRGLWER